MASQVGPNVVTGDALAFNVSDWAISPVTGNLVGGGTDWGLNSTNGTVRLWSWNSTDWVQHRRKCDLVQHRHGE